MHFIRGFSVDWTSIHDVKEFTNDGANHLAIVRVQPSQPLVYSLAAGWSKSGDFPNADAWTHLEKILAQLREPLKVSIKYNEYAPNHPPDAAPV